MLVHKHHQMMQKHHLILSMKMHLQLKTVVVNHVSRRASEDVHDHYVMVDKTAPPAAPDVTGSHIWTSKVLVLT